MEKKKPHDGQASTARTKARPFSSPAVPGEASLREPAEPPSPFRPHRGVLRLSSELGGGDSAALEAEMPTAPGGGDSASQEAETCRWPLEEVTAPPGKPRHANGPWGQRQWSRRGSPPPLWWLRAKVSAWPSQCAENELGPGQQPRPWHFLGGGTCRVPGPREGSQ